jgi:hypothetical protein
LHDHRAQIVGPRQAADMGRQNPIGAAFHDFLPGSCQQRSAERTGAASSPKGFLPDIPQIAGLFTPKPSRCNPRPLAATLPESVRGYL